MCDNMNAYENKIERKKRDDYVGESDCIMCEG